MNETLEYFSEDGRPLRAQLSVSLTQQEIQFKFGQQTGAGLGANPMPGTRPQQTARQGDTVQSMAGDSGRQDKWQGDALRNGVENPRRPETGRPLDMGSPSVPSASPALGVQLPAAEVGRPSVAVPRPVVSAPGLTAGR